MELAPAVHTTQKSRFHPSAVDDIIAAAVARCHRIPHTIAVAAGREIVALVRGGPEAVAVLPITHGMWCGFGGYLELERAIKKGKFYRSFFHKTHSSFNVADRWFDVWPIGGTPSAGDYSGTANTARQFDSSTTGALQVGPQPANGETKHVVGFQFTNLTVSNSVNYTGLFYDRVLAYDGGVISTSTTTMTNTLAAQRYIGSGEQGLSIMVTATTANALGATASNLTSLTYTDNDGNNAQAIPTTDTLSWLASASQASGTQAATVVVPYSTAISAGWGPFLPLAAGDSGVRLIEGYTSSANNTGNVCFVLAKPLCFVFSGGTGTTQRVDLARAMFNMERVYDGACVNLMAVQAAGNATTAYGHVNFAWG